MEYDKWGVLASWKPLSSIERMFMQTHYENGTVVTVWESSFN